MVNIQSFTDFLFSNTAILTLVTITFTSSGGLLIPIWPVVIDTSAVPGWAIFTSQVFALPFTFTIEATKKYRYLFKVTGPNFVCLSAIKTFCFNLCFPGLCHTFFTAIQSATLPKLATSYPKFLSALLTNDNWIKVIRFTRWSAKEMLLSFNPAFSMKNRLPAIRAWNLYVPKVTLAFFRTEFAPTFFYLMFINNEGFAAILADSCEDMFLPIFIVTTFATEYRIVLCLCPAVDYIKNSVAILTRFFEAPILFTFIGAFTGTKQPLSLGYSRWINLEWLPASFTISNFHKKPPLGLVRDSCLGKPNANRGQRYYATISRNCQLSFPRQVYYSIERLFVQMGVLAWA
jgi:hypothetical protein